MSPSECTSFQFDDPEFKCEVIDGACKLIECSEKCENFIPTNPLYQCFKEGNNCFTDLKECEDLDNNLCEKWNAAMAEDEDDDDDEREYQCVKGENKCKLVKNKNSSMGLNISFGFFIIISFIL